MPRYMERERCSSNDLLRLTRQIATPVIDPTTHAAPNANVARVAARGSVLTAAEETQVTAAAAKATVKA